MNQTDEIIDYLFGLKDIEFSKKIIHQVKRCLIDYLGVTFAGAKILHEKIEKFHFLSHSGEKSVSAIGLSQKTDIYSAILINGFNSHVAELDDGVRFGAIHPGSPIFSALLPVAEKEHVDFKVFVNSIIISYEAAILLSTLIQPSHYNKGFHPTSTCGSIAVALGVAILLRCNKKQFKDAFSAAVVSSSGSLKVIEDGSEIKPYNSGRAALVGYISAITAMSGFSGPVDALSGETGFFKMMSEDVHFIIPYKGRGFQIEKVYFKLYAACRHAHPAIEAVLTIKEKYQNSFLISDIKSVTVQTYKGVIGKHDNKIISNEYSAKMSIPFGVALALIKGNVNIDQFTKSNVNDEEIKFLVDKVKIVADEKLSALVPKMRAAIVSIETYDKITYQYRVDYPKGEPENPISDIELDNKFLNLLKFSGIKRSARKQILDSIKDIESDYKYLFTLI